MNRFRPFLAATGIALLAGACAAPRMLAVPQPLPAPASSGASNDVLGMQDAEQASQQPTSLRRTDTPRLPGLTGTDARGVLVAGAAGEPMPPLKGGSVNVNIEGKQTVSKEAVYAHIRLRKGMKFDQRALDQSIRSNRRQGQPRARLHDYPQIQGFANCLQRQQSLFGGAVAKGNRNVRGRAAQRSRR